MGKSVEPKPKKRRGPMAGSHSSKPRKLSPAGAKIVAAFQEAIEIAQSGEALPGRLTARSCRSEFVRPSYGPEDVRRVRDLLRMSQVVFASFLGVDPNTIRSWEQGTRPPSSIARRFMGEIEDDLAYWQQRIGHIDAKRGQEPI